MTLTKRDLVLRLSEKTGLQQQQVLELLEKTLDCVSQALIEGCKVELRNFGVFELKVRKARLGRNPRAPATQVEIPERSVVKFKPGKELRDAVLHVRPPSKTPDQASPGQPSPEQA